MKLNCEWCREEFEEKDGLQVQGEDLLFVCSKICKERLIDELEKEDELGGN